MIYTQNSNYGYGKVIKRKIILTAKIVLINKITRMTAFIKVKIKKSDRKASIANHRVTRHTLLQNNISEHNFFYYVT